MSTFSNCLDIINRLPESDQTALVARLEELQARGLSAKDAQLQAALDVLAQAEGESPRISLDAGAGDERIRWSTRRTLDPEETVTAYKLFRTDPKRPGQLFPLFVNANKAVPIGEWLEAEVGPAAAPTKTGLPQVKSKLGGLAFRPGWHAGDYPVATHIGGKPERRMDEESGKAKKLPTLREPNQVWAEVEMAADVDWQQEANKRGTNKKGQLVPGKAHITDQIPKGGFYRYKTNANMTGNWLIGGEMKVNRVLTDDEVKAINDAAGLSDLPRAQPVDLAAMGFDIRKSADRVIDTPEFKRWFGDSKVVDSQGKPLVVYHGTAKNFAKFDPSLAGRNYLGSGAERGIFFTSNPGTASVYAEQPAFAYLDPADQANARFGDGTANIMPVYLSIQNPIVISTKKSPDKFFDQKWREIFRRVDERGHDGVIVRGGAEFERDLYIALRPEQIKSAIGNSGQFNPADPDIRKSAEREISLLGFYSALADGIAKVQSKELGAPGWKQALKAMLNKGQVKQDEIDWSGINEFLDLQQGKITKDAVLEYLRSNGVQVEETVLGGAGSMSKDLEDYVAMNGGDTTTAEGWLSIAREAEIDAKRFQRAGYLQEQADLHFRLAEEANEMAERLETDSGRSFQATKFSQYGPPGGENYREVLLTFPTKGGAAPTGEVRFDPAGDEGHPWAIIVNGKEVNRSSDEMTAPDILQEELERAKKTADKKAEYRSGHWNQPNVIAHIRMDDRTDADGKRVLFIREIQSDWGQEGKKKGFRDDATQAGLKAAAVAARQRAEELYQALVREADSLSDAEYQRRMDEMLDARNASDDATIASGTFAAGNQDRMPTAPFVQKTDAWVGLALKRAIVMAAQEGYDKVALINGEQAADMFDLSKQIESIGYDPKSQRLEAYDRMRLKVFDERGVTEDKLEDYIGKEVAKRLLETKPVMGKHLLDGEDIKVGGEGMKAFYDNIVPKVAKDVVKKLGGQLGTVSVQAGENRDAGFVSGSEVMDALGIPEDEQQQYWGGLTQAQRDKLMSDYRNRDAVPSPQTGFDITPEMREKVEAGVPLFSRDRVIDTPEFKQWFGDSKVVDADGKPLVVYHGTAADFSVFKPSKNGLFGPGIYFTTNPTEAEDFAYSSPEATGENIVPAYLSIQKPYRARQGDTWADIYEDVLGTEPRNADEEFPSARQAREMRDAMMEMGLDGIRVAGMDSHFVAFRPEQVKSATGNNGNFDPASPDIRRSADRSMLDQLGDFKLANGYKVADLFKSSKKLSWRDRTVGTQYNIAQNNSQFKRVFDAVQSFINDVSAYASRAADEAQSILPKLETLADIKKKPLSLEDTKALSDPIFGGTLKYARDKDGNIYEEDYVQAAGVVFTDEELRDMFRLDDRQIGLYREFRSAVDRSVTDLALSDMVRYLGKDGEDIATEIMASGNLTVAQGIIESHLAELARLTPSRAEVLESTADAIGKKVEQAEGLMERGYAPLSRFGQYTVYVVGKGGEQQYFGLFETQREANKMAREMGEQYPDSKVSTGTMSQESYKLFSGVTPETLALFGDSLGLEESGIDRNSEIFQQYLKLAKTNRSAMKRLIERKGIDGFSEDAGRVLAGFVYSNARQISTNLHAGEIGKAASEVKDGDVKDAAVRLMQYIQNPQEEAQAIRGLLFTQFIGGSVASAIVNMTQPFTMTMPYLSQFDGATGAGKRMADAVNLVSRGIRNDADLQDALKRAEADGIVSPQEVHQLMAQAAGRGSLQTGDGTRVGDALAKANNFMAKVGLGWGKLFSAAEQFNRRVTFIAAYKMARDQKMDNPFEFATQAIIETQGLYNKGNKPVWARGAVGGTLFTFKQYSIAYLEFLRRMWGNGPEGKKAVGLALGVLFLTAGLGGMPGADDLDDVIDGFAQRVLGKSFDSKQAKKEFFAAILGQSGAEFVMSGLTGLPGAPIDLSGRLGLGNLFPGTGTLTKKSDYGRDIAEVFGPFGSFISQIAAGGGKLAQGELLAAAKDVAPVSIQNVLKGVDMATMGMYRDQRGRKVIDTEIWEAVVKGIGFQPQSVKRVQDATSTQQGLIAQNKLRETEIADKWAAGRIERKPEKVEEAKAELAEWNRKNPDSPISIDQGQINRRVQQAMMDKAKRLEKTAPKEIRESVRRELERAN